MTSSSNLETRMSAMEVQMQEIRELLQQTAALQNETTKNIDRLSQRQDQTQAQLERLGDRIDQTTANIDRLEQSQEQTNQLLQNFICEWSRVHANDAERIARADAAATENREAVKRLTNTLEGTNLRLGDVLDYLRKGDRP